MIADRRGGNREGSVLSGNIGNQRGSSSLRPASGTQAGRARSETKDRQSRESTADHLFFRHPHHAIEHAQGRRKGKGTANGCKHTTLASLREGQDRSGRVRNPLLPRFRQVAFVGPEPENRGWADGCGPLRGNERTDGQLPMPRKRIRQPTRGEAR